MSWFTEWFKLPTTANKAVEVGEKITDGVIAGIDKVWYTEEEKAEAKQKASETILAFWDRIAQENTEQSIARRELAKMTFKVYFYFLIAGSVLWKVDPAWAKFMFECAGAVTFLVSAIGIIYFGPHQLSKVVTKKD